MNAIKRIFTPDWESYNGIRPINIYLMRLVYLLMATFLAFDVWSYIITNDQAWEPSDAMDWSVWAAFSTLALIGIFRPIELIPILLLEVIYKSVWLILVALPLFRTNGLSVESTDGMIFPFALVVLPIIAIPWGYVLSTYILLKKPENCTKQKIKSST